MRVFTGFFDRGEITLLRLLIAKKSLTPGRVDGIHPRTRGFETKDNLAQSLVLVVTQFYLGDFGEFWY
jgi:hypothetical protein